MTASKWVLLTETLGSDEAELMKLYFEAREIPLRVIEGINTASAIPVTFGRVLVYAEETNIDKARVILLQYEKETK